MPCSFAAGEFPVMPVTREEVPNHEQKRVFISSRINEMRDFREAAIRAIDQAGMETVFVDSTDRDKRFPLKRGVPLKRQLIEAVKASDVFVGIYGDTLQANWIPPGENRHIMVEYVRKGSNLPLTAWL